MNTIIKKLLLPLTLIAFVPTASLRCMDSLPGDLDKYISSLFMEVMLGCDYSISQKIKVGKKRNSLRVTVAVSSDGKKVLTGSGDGIACLWDAETGTLEKEFTGDQASIWSVALSPDGKKILTGLSDRTARLLDIETGNELQKFEGEIAYTISSAVFSSDGKKIVTGSSDGIAYLWDIGTSNPPQKFPREALEEPFFEPFWAACTPDGKIVLTASRHGKVCRWDSTTGEQLATFTGNKVTARLIRADEEISFPGCHDRTSYCWDESMGDCVQKITEHGYIASMTLSPDGKTILIGSTEKFVLLFDALTGNQLKEFTGAQAIVNAVAFSPDGKTVIAGSADKIYLWDISTGQLLKELTTECPGAAITSAALSSDGDVLAIGSDDLYDEIVVVWKRSLCCGQWHTRKESACKLGIEKGLHKLMTTTAKIKKIEDPSKTL